MDNYSKRVPKNADIRRIANQPPLSSIIKSRRLTFFGHLARMDENADASQAIFETPPENWRRPPGRPRTTWVKNFHDDLSSMDLGIYEAGDLAQNWPLWGLMFLHSVTWYNWMDVQTAADCHRLSPTQFTSPDATRQFCRVGSGGVNWIQYVSACRIPGERLPRPSSGWA